MWHIRGHLATSPTRLQNSHCFCENIHRGETCICHSLGSPGSYWLSPLLYRYFSSPFIHSFSCPHDSHYLAVTSLSNNPWLFSLLLLQNCDDSLLAPAVHWQSLCSSLLRQSRSIIPISCLRYTGSSIILARARAAQHSAPASIAPVRPAAAVSPPYKRASRLPLWFWTAFSSLLNRSPFSPPNTKTRE